jgi:hypothetical protein
MGVPGGNPMLGQFPSRVCFHSNFSRGRLATIWGVGRVSRRAITPLPHETDTVWETARALT